MAWKQSQQGIYFKTQFIYQDSPKGPAIQVSSSNHLPLERLPSGELGIHTQIKEGDVSRTRIVITPYESRVFVTDVDIPYQNSRLRSMARQKGTIRKLQVVLEDKTVQAMNMFVGFPSVMNERISLLSGSVSYEASHSPNLNISNLMLKDTRCFRGTLEGTIPRAVRDEFVRLTEVYPAARNDLEYCVALLLS